MPELLGMNRGMNGRPLGLNTLLSSLPVLASTASPGLNERDLAAKREDVASFGELNPPFSDDVLRGKHTGLASWQTLDSFPGIVLHPATTKAINEARARGYIEFVHPLQGSAGWVIFLDGNCNGGRLDGQASTSWAFYV